MDTVAKRLKSDDFVVLNRIFRGWGSNRHLSNWGNFAALEWAGLTMDEVGTRAIKLILTDKCLSGLLSVIPSPT